MIEQTHEYIFSTYARYPIALIRGEGAYVWDIQGKKYLDLLSGIACTPLGHCHPAVTEAIIQQAQTLLHTSNLYYTAPGAALAECLVQHGGLDKVFFCNSGAEANEAAIKLARKYHSQHGHPQKSVILSAAHSFHGRTLGALAATAKPAIQNGFGPLPTGFKHADWQDVSHFCAAITDDVAAVILEPIQGESGIHPAAPELLAAVREKCQQTGALLIFDEVQCGVGRTGHLFAYQHYQIEPDIVTLAKGLANGLPIGAVCASKTIAQAFAPGDHGSTFGANPVSCQAALAVLNTLLTENYLPHIQKLSHYLFQNLHELQQQYPNYIRQIRGIGLMLGIELSIEAKPILAYCQAQGILFNVVGNHIIRLLPPYVISENDIDIFIEVLDSALEQTDANK